MPGSPRQFIFIVFLFFFSCPAGVCFAQQSSHPVYEAQFGSIPDSLFQMEVYEPDPSAPFVYLFKDLDVTFEEDDRSIVAILDYHVRIKIFDSSARQAALVAIPYYFEEGIEEVENIRAATYTSSGRRISLPEGAIKTININSRYNVREFMMPGVEDGAVLEYAYRIRRRYIEELPDFFLAHRAPTYAARVSIKYPGYLRYSAVAENFEGTVHHHAEQIDTSSAAKIFTVPRPEPLLKETWVAYKIPAVEEEAYISSLDDYRGKIKFQLSEFGVPRQKLENSWDFVIAQLRHNQNVLETIENNTRAKKLGRSISEALSSKEAVQDSIFRYVNTHANFNEARSPYSNLTAEPVLEGKPVNQAAINQTLLSMLQGAGIEAYPVLISTREFGQINKDFPSFFQFNSQLVYSRIGNETFFMDASFRHSQPNLIPIDTYNETGLLLKPDSFKWLEITPSKSIFSISIHVDARLDARGNISGKIEAVSRGYPAQVIREQSADGASPGTILEKAIFDGYANVMLSNIKVSNVTGYEQPIRMKADFVLENYATSFSDGIRFRPMIVGYLMSNPFNEGRRDLPVTLDAPEKLDLVYEIELPPGYTLGDGAKNRTIRLPGARLTESYDARGQTIRYEFHIDISRKQFEPELYPQLLDLYKRWVRLSNSSWHIEKD